MVSAPEVLLYVQMLLDQQ